MPLLKKWLEEIDFFSLRCINQKNEEDGLSGYIVTGILMQITQTEMERETSHRLNYSDLQCTSRFAMNLRHFFIKQLAAFSFCIMHAAKCHLYALWICMSSALSTHVKLSGFHGQPSIQSLSGSL